MWLNNDKTRALMDINELASICGYFFDDETSVTGGYRCNHPECYECQNGAGICMVGSCPLGWGAEEEDFEDFGLEEDDDCIVTDNEEILKKGSELEEE